MPIILSGEQAEEAILSLLIDKYSQCLTPDKIIIPGSTTSPDTVYLSGAGTFALCVISVRAKDYKPHKTENGCPHMFRRGINDNTLNKAIKKCSSCRVI